MGKLLISEEEKKYIKSLYNLTEQTEQTENLILKKRIEFPAGYYNESYLSVLNPEIVKVENFLRTNVGKDYNISVTIQAGESKIPNYDKEVTPNVIVPQGFLAKKRYETISNFILRELGKLKESKLIKNEPKIEPVILDPGKTKWVGQDFCPSESLSKTDTDGHECLRKDFKKTKNGKPNWVNGKNSTYKDLFSAYTQEQFVSVIIKASKESKIENPCMDNMQIQINYTTDRGHICNSSVYEVRINGILLRRNDGELFASLNNLTGPKDFDTSKTYTREDIQFYDNSIKINRIPDKGGFRTNIFIITPEIAKTLLSGGQDKFIITVKCVNPTNLSHSKHKEGCHKGVGDVLIINGTGQKYAYAANTPTGRDEEIAVLTIDSCGKQIKTT